MATTKNNETNAPAGFYHNYNPPPRFFEDNHGVSLTDTNPDFSVREMVTKYVTGKEVSSAQVYFNPEVEEAIESGQDLADIYNAIDFANEQLKKDVAKAKEQREKEKAEKDAAMLKALAELEELKSKQPLTPVQSTPK